MAVITVGCILPGGHRHTDPRAQFLCLASAFYQLIIHSGECSKMLGTAPDAGFGSLEYSATIQRKSYTLRVVRVRDCAFGPAWRRTV